MIFTNNILIAYQMQFYREFTLKEHVLKFILILLLSCLFLLIYQMLVL